MYMSDFNITKLLSLYKKKTFVQVKYLKILSLKISTVKLLKKVFSLLRIIQVREHFDVFPSDFLLFYISAGPL